jgi:hypothetical protein
MVVKPSCLMICGRQEDDLRVPERTQQADAVLALDLALLAGDAVGEPLPLLGRKPPRLLRPVGQ